MTDKRQPGVGTPVEETREGNEITFKLEVANPAEFTERMLKHLGELFPGASSLRLDPHGRELSAHYLDGNYTRGVSQDSYVSAVLDEHVLLRTEINSLKVIPLQSFQLDDVGAPRLTQIGSVVRSHQTTRDGRLFVGFDNNYRPESSSARVIVSGHNRGALITAASGYLLGIKAAQEMPR